MVLGKGNDEQSLKLFGVQQEEQWDRLAAICDSSTTGEEERNAGLCRSPTPKPS
ncbi:hypothetical protein [Microbispora sp. H10949]|uniref:hypothetical protein n=1 Tax=Microbispora sp. H10949 TaxID=2729111 RepID=UPI002175F748|nr:hypothetical protein [Microbispora sp. H10949]